MITDYDVNDANFQMLAIKAYDKPNAIMAEFLEDYKRVKYIKRLIGKYRATGDLKTRLILNHIIVLGNVFGVDFTVRMLLLKLDPDHIPVAKTFLIYLGYMPESIRTIRGKLVWNSDISVDLRVAEYLRSI